MNLTELRLTSCCTVAAGASAGAPEGPAVAVSRVDGGMLRGGEEAVLEVTAVGPEDRVCSIC